ncbi:DUF4381 domain-containing protein [Blastopirellula marina]|uniref:DUF4381 domain-containing protein n=1 Tax=Blastopirellula marina TaxID=124 RepID=A0A2S8F569_9BACT|nr:MULTISPECIES: DUF4381 domain-containing protein [Pirellulaceae]PQO27315.1 DUF4381 domain-containing protein [Blastopirellula marina]RCS47852.1 DUF4381 domain-containing protein [Bremerella cremea]
MTDDPASLDLLHDIVVPPEVPWWPLAPGWYILFAIALLSLTYWAYRCWAKWQANAYRRVALQELSAAGSIADVSQLLRRTALKIAPRPVIASLTGSEWPEWLATCFPEPMPDACRTQLADGGYARVSSSSDLETLKEYAHRWIKLHHPPEVCSEVKPQA